MTTQTSPWILYLAIWIHLCFGISLIGNSQVSTLAVLTGINIATENDINHILLGFTLILFALSAICGLIIEKRIGRKAFFFVFPQYCILIIAIISDVYTLYSGRVMGREVDFWLLFSVLNIMIGLGFFHSCAILERYYFKWIQE